MINLDDKVVKEVINILVTPDPDSRQLYLQSIKNESGEGTQNSKGTHGWDYRYNSFIEIAKKFNLRHIKLGRGKLWEAILLLGPEDEIYVCFSESNLKRIIKKGKDSHYLRLLNLFNKELDDMKVLSQQMTLFDQVVEERDVLERQSREMLHMMETDPSKVVVFAFDTAFISTAKAYAFNTNHQIVWEEDLTDLIDVNYHSVLKDDNVKPERRISGNINETKKEKKVIVRLKS